MTRKVSAAFIVISTLILASYSCGRKEPQQVTIGAILPLTGDAAQYGETAKMGIDLAVEEINVRGGVRGKKMQVLFEDDKAEPKEGVNAFQKLKADGVPAIIGPMPSSVMLAIAPLAEQAGVVLLSPAASAPEISKAGDFVFRNNVSDTFEGSVMAEFVREKLKLNRMAILYINNDYGLGLRNVFKGRFEDLGGKVLLTEPFDQGSADFRAQLSKLRNLRVDGIYLVGYKEMINVLIQAKELRIRHQVLSSVMFDDPDIVQKAGQAAEGVIFTTWAFDPKSKDTQMRDFADRFRSKYKRDPEVFAAHAYDAVYLLAKAIEAQGASAAEIKNGLYEIKDFPGASGLTSFDANGDVVKPLRIMTVKNGKFVNLELLR